MLEGVYERFIRMKLATTRAATLGLLLHWLALRPTRLGRSTFNPTCPELNLKLLCNLVILLERCGSCDAHWANMTISVQRSEFFPSRGDAPELEIAVWNHYALNGVGFDAHTRTLQARLHIVHWISTTGSGWQKQLNNVNTDFFFNTPFSVCSKVSAPTYTTTAAPQGARPAAARRRRWRRKAAPAAPANSGHALATLQAPRGLSSVA